MAAAGAQGRRAALVEVAPLRELVGRFGRAALETAGLVMARVMDRVVRLAEAARQRGFGRRGHGREEKVAVMAQGGQADRAWEGEVMELEEEADSVVAHWGGRVGPRVLAWGGMERDSRVAAGERRGSRGSWGWQEGPFVTAARANCYLRQRQWDHHAP